MYCTKGSVCIFCYLPLHLLTFFRHYLICVFIFQILTCIYIKLLLLSFKMEVGKLAIKRKKYRFSKKDK